ncbi:MAG: hypothetical protein LCI02_17390 [Proteobacteria bacterium]|nr:hypothetical protein [Pseudomonadota bacterium]
MFRRRVFCLAALLAAAGGAAAQTPPLRELHGALDAWAEPGLALAWAIARGKREDDTQVLIRIEADPQRHARIAAQGRDPFGGAAVELLAPTANPGVLTLRLPRKQFSEHPRTELRFYAPGANEAAVLVYYLGVPDTTPESASDGEATQDLKERLSRARQRMP